MADLEKNSPRNKRRSDVEEANGPYRGFKSR